MVGILKPSLHYYTEQVVIYEGVQPSGPANLADRLLREHRRGQPLWQQLGSNATLVYGSTSPVVTHGDVATLRSTNPAPAILAVEGAGHMVPWDRPAPTIALLRSLLHPLKLSRQASAETP